MRLRTRRGLKAGGAALALLIGAFAGHGWWRARAGLGDVLPAFTEPGAGPRAPRSDAFGLQVGVTSLAQARAHLARRGIACADTSMRAMMAELRAEKRREMAARQARGEDPDAVSGASMVNRKSPKESNPQVRLSCEGVDARALGDRPRPEATGRLLLVFDSPAHPLRHVSFERTFPATAEPAARADAQASVEAAAVTFGATERPGPTFATALAWLSPVEATWRFADLQARVSALHYGARGVVVSEIVEVPWPVRADATFRPRLD